MLLYKPNAVLGIRSWSHFFYQWVAMLSNTLNSSGFGGQLLIFIGLNVWKWPWHMEFLFQNIPKNWKALQDSHSHLGRHNKASPYDITGYLAAVTITIFLITNSLNNQLQISHPPYYVLEEKANSIVFEKDPLWENILKSEFLNKLVSICFHSVTLQGRLLVCSGGVWVE